MTLAEQIKQLINDENLTQVKIAKEVGVSTAMLSTYLKGTYQGSQETIETALNTWLQTREKKQRELVIAPLFIETATAKQIWATLDFAKMFATIATIYGASGVGKTKSAQEYRKNTPNTWLITASPSRATLSSILYEMALELGINDAPRRKDKLSRLIIKKLQGTAGLIIIDEADHLPYDALEEIRIMQEQAEIGFVLIGNDKVYNRLRGGINQAHEFARLWSRIGKNTSIQKCKKTDIKAIANAWNLDTTDTDLMNTLYQIGGVAGGLRSLTQYLRLAGFIAKGENKLITLDLILSAKQQMEGENQ